jgi:hypothetical protein
MQKKEYEMIKGEKVQIGRVSKEKYEIWSQLNKSRGGGLGSIVGKSLGCDIFQLAVS